ncbi:hypothetical protein BK799_29120 [Rhodococcus sp. D-1]|nr:hypothetical protein BK799_29120 [Rhodococcus sp. D-1]
MFEAEIGEWFTVLQLSRRPTFDVEDVVRGSDPLRGCDLFAELRVGVQNVQSALHMEKYGTPSDPRATISPSRTTSR